MLDVKRREFIMLLGGAAAAWPLAGRAQPSGKVYRIGFLGVTSRAEYRRQVDVFLGGLRRLGYEEGRNIVIEYRWAEGRYDRLPALAAELVKLNLDVLVTHSTPGAQAARQATSTVPIVMAIVGDPVAAGLVASLSRPAGNLTGLTFFFPEVCAKRVELMKDALPALTRLAALVNPANASHPIALAEMQRTAGALKLELVPVNVTAREDIAPAIAAVAAQPAPALVAVDDPLIISNAGEIAAAALRERVPMVGFKPQAEAGALLEYGIDILDLYSRSAALVDKILRGKPPGELPIERAVKFDLVVNLRTARTLGIELPTSILLRADEVIE